MEEINKRIKELYSSKALFCEKNNYSYKDFSKKLRTVENRFNWLNEFLAPLNLKIEITHKEDS